MERNLTFESKTPLRIILIILSITCLTGCSSHHVASLSGLPRSDLSSYHTYSWPEINKFDYETRSWDAAIILDRMIKKNIDVEFSRVGFQLADSSGQLEIDYRFIDADNLALLNSSTRGRPSERLNGRRETFSLLKGTIFIDLMDSKSCELVWWGFINQVTNENSGGLQEKDVQSSLKKLFKLYPVR